MKIFSGSAVAIVTPFDENKEIDYKNFEKLLEFHFENKTDAIVICGTTGESATLSDEEKISLIKFAVKKSEGRIPIIAGVGSNNTNHAKNLTMRAKDVGANACLIVTPYYNKTTQMGLVEHYAEISKVDLPIIIYNVPSRTGLNILPDTYKNLLQLENIVAVKEASGNISQVAEISALTQTEKNFSIYSGNDDQIVPTLSLGGDGVISVLANISPKQTHDICQEYFNGNIKKSLDLQLKFVPLIKNLFCEVNPIPIKTAMNMMGFEVGECRLPLTKMSNENRIKLLECINLLRNNLY